MRYNKIIIKFMWTFMLNTSYFPDFIIFYFILKII